MSCKHRRPLFHNQVCKPGSVIDSHLSRHSVTTVFKPPSRKQPGKPCFLCGVAPDRVCSDGCFHTIGCALTAPFHPYLREAVYLCCTFPEVAFGGRYPLSLPCGARTFLMYGLSAWHTRLSDLVAVIFYFIFYRKSNVIENQKTRGYNILTSYEMRHVYEQARIGILQFFER